MKKFKLNNRTIILASHNTGKIAEFESLFSKYNVNIHDFDVINTNQIFARDLGFIISDKFFISSILPDREIEIEGLRLKVHGELHVYFSNYSYICMNIINNWLTEDIANWLNN